MRDFKLDNIKGLLIFLVVFGHLLESCDESYIAHTIYILIYSFHMPAFVFCSGITSKYNPKRILSAIVYPYCIFQALYLVVMKQRPFTMLKPQWLMWYLFALAAWRFSLKLVKTKQIAIRLLPFSIILCLAVNFVPSIRDYLSLSRIICLYPFFLMGYILSGNDDIKENFWTTVHKFKHPIALVLALSLLILDCFSPLILNSAMYFKSNYATLGSTLFRASLLVISSLSICCLFMFIKDWDCILTKLGRNSMAIYMLHGFAVILYKRLNLYFGALSIILCFAVAVFICLILSMDVVSRFFSPLFSFPKKRF